MTRAETIVLAPVAPLLCTLLVLASGSMLLMSWTGSLRSVEQTSVAIVFAGALIARCILAARR